MKSLRTLLTIGCALAAIGGTTGLLHAQPYSLDDTRVLRVTSGSVHMGSTLDVDVRFDHPENGGCHDETAGWAITIEHDPAVVAIENVVPGSATLALTESLLSFSSLEIHAEGFTASVLSSLTGTGATLPFGLDLPLYTATYTTVAPGSATVQPCDCLDWSTLITFFSSNCSDQEYVPLFEAGTITVLPPVEFIRGDANADGGIDLFDPIFLLNWFFGDAELDCTDLADVNDNGVLEGIVDPVSLLNYLFAQGMPPAAPFPACGVDPTKDELVCPSFGCP